MSLSGIPTRNSSKEAAADPRLRPRSHWSRPLDKPCHWQKEIKKERKNDRKKERKTARKKVLIQVIVRGF
jgi:hypothetical protein